MKANWNKQNKSIDRFRAILGSFGNKREPILGEN